MGFHVGQTFGDYSITALVGAGGMGRVYKVENTLTKRTEAMKILAAEVASDIQVKRFEREMRALARLSHPNIAELHNAIHSENQLILLMEFIDGQTLENIFAGGRLPLDSGIGYVKQMLSALGYAHHQGIVHRDVTPANVIVTTGGQVKLADFGLSKSYGDPLLTNCGEVLGSLPYLAPEQLKGTTQPDRRSDLYSVGAILYEHLTGQKPFGANRRLAPVLTDSEGEPRPPSQIEPGLSPHWDDVISRALARDPMHRYQSAEEFLDAIAQFDQPAEADLPLPQLRNLGIGIALFAGLALAFVASPIWNLLRPVAPASAAWQRMHIAPPKFALAPPALATPETAPAQDAVATASARPELGKPAKVRHAKRLARSAPFPVEVSAFQPHPVLAPTGNAPTAPIASPEPASPPDVPAQGDGAPVAVVATESSPSQTPPPAKRRFWSKLNVFKKKSADPKDKP